MKKTITATATTKTKMKTKIIVLDDDPTGSQTVHSCLLLTRWDVETLKIALTDDSSPLFFVLTNTRGFSREKAANVTREVCVNLKSALSSLAALNDDDTNNISINPILVSRSDSTLRGHYPVETDIIAEELGPFDAHFLIPAFFPFRITRNGTHYCVVVSKIKEEEEKKLIPCHETEFANDSVFGYSTAYLPDYVTEKTRGGITADLVEHFRLNEVQGNCTDRLLSLKDNVCCIIDCEEQSDLDQFAKQLNEALVATPLRPKKFLFRSGASILTSLAMLPPQPIPAEDMGQYVKDRRPGVILVGSHVKKTTSQLNELLKLDNIVGLEVDVKRIQNKEESDRILIELVARIKKIHDEGKHPVIYTSRTELTSFENHKERLQFGEQVSNFLMEIVKNLPLTLGFLISKGGITSNDVLSNGLELKTSRVLGQILPGCSVIKCPLDHIRYPNMPVVIFPGNVGNEFGLVTTFQRLSSSSSS
jgi:uncharacterized protein YgbK (DUF1537 family)